MSDFQEGQPSISAKLSRLAELEANFQRLLEIEKLEAIAEFAAGAGHEINNPLTVISGRAQLLLRDESDPERRHALALISAQAMRVHEMIADMMLFARPPRPEPKRIELVALIDSLVADMLPRCRKQETSLSRVGDSAPIHVEADPVQLNVALRAIVQNALEALGSGGHIEIEIGHVLECGDSLGGQTFLSVSKCHAMQDRQECLSSCGEARICIRDDGPGIKPEEHRHLFDPYYSARQAGRGLGLGLSKAWRIIANHGGRIEVSSEPGHGAAFTVTLPLSN